LKEKISEKSSTINTPQKKKNCEVKDVRDYVPPTPPLASELIG